MRTIQLLVMTLFSAVVPLAWAADALTIFVYPCPRAQTAPTIDGQFDDPCWEAATVVGGFTYFRTNELMPVQTFFRATYDEVALYFAVTCDEPTPKKVNRITVPRDDDRIYRQESIEIFLDPGHTHDVYYQLGINAAGAFWDCKFTAVGKQWDGDIVVATAVGEDAWYTEVAIAWRDLGVKSQPGQVHGFNVCRNRWLDGREWSNWAGGELGGFHNNATWGHLVLSRTAEQINVQDAEFRKGERTGPIRVFTDEGFGVQSYRLQLNAALKKVQARVADLHQIAEQEPQEVRQELQRLLEPHEAEIDKLRQVVNQTVDSQTFTRLEVRLNKLSTVLKEVIWEARLQALLSGG